ncbi:MAG: sugar transferase [Anaerolineae bacterium]
MINSQGTTPHLNISTTTGTPDSGLPKEQLRRQRIPVHSLSLTTSERHIVLLLVDVLVLNGALLGALVLRYGYPFSSGVIVEAPHYFILLTIIWGIWACFFDCYDLVRSADASQSVWSTGRAGLLTALTYLTVPYLTPQFPASRLSAYLFIGLTTTSVPLWRVVYATIFSQPSFQQRILIVGAGKSGAELVHELSHKPHFGNPYAGSGYRVVGFVDDDPAKAGKEVQGVPILGNRHDLLRLVQAQAIDGVIVAITHPPHIHPELLQALLDCREQGVRLEPMTCLYERLTGKVPVEHAGQNIQVVMPPSEAPMQRAFWAGKRLLDLLVGLLGLLVLALVSPLVALANAVSSPGPLFYMQTRVGKAGRRFKVFKFRSMIPDAEKGSGAVWSREGDDRVTPVGRLLRRTRLDELPQFINVLKGEMSLVGPRPERPEFVADLVAQVPFYQARHAVRPGITGWAQVRYRYGSSAHDALVKLQYDLYYIRHQSVYLEISILVKTAAVMIGLKGR